MTTPAEQSGTPEGTPALTPQEQTSVEVGQRGLSEPTGVNEPKPTGPQRPEWCPEQFFKDGQVDAEGLAKSYGALRSKMDSGQSQEQQPPAAEQQQQAPVHADGKIEKTQGANEGQPSPLTSAIDAVRAEFGEKGEVSDETVATLEQAGIPKEILGTYLKGLELITQQAMGEIHGFAEGKDNYEAMSRWAAEKLSDDELNAYNDALDNPQLRENAVRGLYARYTQARPSEGRLITPAGTPSAAGDVYSSRDQLVADQRDPRYASDPAFRQTVMEKLQRSQRTGFAAFQRPMFERQILSN
jgi:hypothetical protein